MIRYFALLAAAVLMAAATCSGDELRAASSVLKLGDFLKTHCLDCHDQGNRAGGLVLDQLDLTTVGVHAETWEKVVRKLSARHMPPQDASRPSEQEYVAATTYLESQLDAHAAAHPRPGRGETFRRLNRTEYKNTIRDLLALDVDVVALLPPDESSHGFDNVTVGDLPATLLNRYVSAAQKISRMAVGRPSRAPAAETFRIRPDVTQDVHIPGTPLGTRGGTAITYNFPQDGVYEVQVRLMRDRNEGVEGLREPHELEVSLDRQRVELFEIKPPPRGQSDQTLDAKLNTRLTVQAGSHELCVAFLKKPSSLLETERQPLNVHFNFYRHPRLGPAVYQISIVGPLESQGAGDTPSRRLIFTSDPGTAGSEDESAREILKTLARSAYRRPVTPQDLEAPLALYRQGHGDGGFEAGIELAIAGILVNPHFLFRIERDPAAASAAEAYRISDVELASRLSYFLWSSMPDDELLDLAEANQLSEPEALERQVRRMLADSRSQDFLKNFAGQWLYLRNLEAVIPDMRLFPDFDDNLRQAMRRETELFVESILREDRGVLDLLTADYTYLNERLAKHYGIPHVYGSDFRRVALDPSSHRGGLLRHASVLTVTSYATRTSPVIRGDWILKNLIGMPTPPPPPNVPALDENNVSSLLSVRERLKQHRADPACASCHDLMDPIGFALDHYDAVGRWRSSEEGQPIDAAGSLADGSEFVGVAGLEQALLKRPELFVRTVTEKLLTFALGRGLEYSDAPAVRKIVRDSQPGGHRLSALIVGIVRSEPFCMRSTR